MSEKGSVYGVHQPYTTMRLRLENEINKNNKLRNENTRLRNEVQLLQDEINGLLACCSLEKKVDYKLKKWLDAEIVGNEETDRQAFTVELVDFIKKDLQSR